MAQTDFWQAPPLFRGHSFLGELLLEDAVVVSWELLQMIDLPLAVGSKAYELTGLALAKFSVAAYHSLEII